MKTRPSTANWSSVRIQRSERYDRSVLVSEGCSEPNVGLGLAVIRTVVKGDRLSKPLKHGMAAERSVWSILSCLDRLRARADGAARARSGRDLTQ